MIRHIEASSGVAFLLVAASEVRRSVEARMGILDGKVALITSAGSGIARETAVRLARDGASVCIVDIDEDGARETASSVREFGRAAIVLHANVRRS